MLIHIGNKYGYINGNIDDRCLYINFVDILPEYQNKGFGILLIEQILNEAASNGVVHVELDDCSDRYRNNHNIYINCGFKYKSKECEMYANLRHSLRCIKNIKLFKNIIPANK